MEGKNIDQSVLAEDVAKNIPYTFLDYFLVKPLDPIKVQKEFSKPVSDKQPTKDANGIEAVDYDNVETEVKEVDSDFRKGIVLKVPTIHSRIVTSSDDENTGRFTEEIKVGDVVLFRERSASFFDLLKDSRMIRYYDIVAIER